MEPAARPDEPSALATDETLVAKLRLRDQVALRALHKRYASLVFTVARRHVDAGTAEEVVQDVFLTIWRKHETFDVERGSFKSWIVQVARRRALNELRRSRGRGKLEGDESLDDLADPDAVEPDEAEWAAHRSALLRRAIEALPAPQKHALSLAFFDELTHEQVATVLRTPVGTAKTRIRLAMKRLAPAVLALVAAVAIVFVWRRKEQEVDLRERALRVVTSSDIVPLRLAASPGLPATAHGTYRAKDGIDVAVLTTTDLPPLSGAERYVAWVREGARWISLGTVELEDSGRSLVTWEDPALASRPDEVRVTREPQSPQVRDAPGGVIVLEWSRPAD